MPASPLPIEPPSKVIAVGLNYRDHAAESGSELPEHPITFAIWPSALIADGDHIVIPPNVDRVDYEAELGVVIDRVARDVSIDDALDFVRGYLCGNDVSARAIQEADGQWTRGKSFDTFCPIGPRLVSADELPDPQALAIRCRVNGELLQDGHTSEMAFSVADLVSLISASTTLLPGDLILTGTPGGVGVGRTPPRFLEPGDLVEVEIDGIGVLSNPVSSYAKEER